MKKVIAIILAVVLVIALIGCTGPKGATGATGPAGPVGTPGINAGDIPPNATILLNENFDSYADNIVPTGWTRASVFTGSEVTITAGPADYVSYPNCLVINTTGSSYEREIVKAPMLPIPNKTSGKLYIRFNVKCSYAMTNRDFLFYLNQTEKVRIKFASDGLIYAYEGSYTLYTALGQYNPALWNQVLTVIDLANSKYSVYIDGTLKVSNLNCLILAERKLDGTPISAANAIYTDFFGMLTDVDSTYSNNATLIDDIAIYYLP
jgi:hypothetical protein